MGVNVLTLNKYMIGIINQRAITLFALLLSQSVSYYTFALFTCTRNRLFGIYCTVVNGA